jgi:DNA-binding response OmpR family regulator
MASSVPPDMIDLAAFIRAFVAAKTPGLLPSHILIHFHNSPVPFSTPITSETSPPPTKAEAVESPTPSNPTIPEEHGLSLSPVIQGILRTLREAGRPLSRTRLLEEMGKRDMDWSERTVACYLAELMADGTIENPEDARPRGYRLAE